MDAQQMRQTATKAKQNNNKLILGGAAAALAFYYFYKKRQGDVANVGDAAHQAGAATGRALERAGEQVGSAGLKSEGRGFEGKSPK